MKSDTDCEGTSESDTQKENMGPTVQKRTTERTPRPAGVEDDQCSDQDELIRKLQNTALTDTGAVLKSEL